MARAERGGASRSASARASAPTPAPRAANPTVPPGGPKMACMDGSAVESMAIKNSKVAG
jgi:hypothetical protein